MDKNIDSGIYTLKQLNDPTNVDFAWSGNLSLCLLLLASSILFFHLAHNKYTRIPHSTSLFVSVFLIVMALLYSIVSITQYIYILNKMDKYCEKKPCLLNDNILNAHKYAYIGFSTLFIFITTFITYILIIHYYGF